MHDNALQAATTTEIIEFDPFSDDFFDDPYDTYRTLRDEAPVYYSDKYDFYALSRHADVLAAHLDAARFSSAYGLTVDMLVNKKPLGSNMMIMMDQPEHTQLRRMINQAFSRRTIEGLEPLVIATVKGFLDELDQRAEFDLIADFAALFPVEVISAMLGVPASDRQRIRHLVDDMLFREVGSAQMTDAGLEASFELATYLIDLVKEKRKTPDDLIISRLIEVRAIGPDGAERRLTDDDVAGFALLISGAGSETVTKLIGNGAALFELHPAQWQLVLDDAATVPAAVEEILRFSPPSQYQGRFTTEEVRLASGVIPAGSPTLLLTGAATRDPRAFERADEFDITRNAHAALAFGHGIHTCLGAWLARLESRVAFEEIRIRWPNFHVALEKGVRVNMANVAGYANLPFTTNCV
jgi:cytochrome P450